MSTSAVFPWLRLPQQRLLEADKKRKNLAFLFFCSWSSSVLTVGLTGSRSVVGAEPRLHLLLAHLELLGVGQQRPAGVPEPLLLPRPVLTDVDRHPGGPGGVAAYLRAGLQVTGFILLKKQHGGNLFALMQLNSSN